ncbi:MAG: ABC transporter permease [Oscillospiraceae bacterium]|nr:ABC transporter permease [Oscillospiraceae bacterium]
MTKKGRLMFSLVRGAMAIGIALLMTALLVFISASGETFAERLAATGDALVNLLVRPIFKSGGGFSAKNFNDILAGMIPTIFTGLSVCVMFSANQFNMGSEGGSMLGAFVAALAAIYLPMAAGLHTAVCLLLGGLAVGLLMVLPGLLKAKLDVSEMVCTLMLNYVIMYVIKYVLNSHLADKSRGQIMTYPFQETALLPQLVNDGSKLSWGFVIALVFVVLVTVFMFRTRWGYAIRMIGINQDFAKYSGIHVGATIVLSQVIGGFLAGLGGGIEMLGRYNTYSWSSLPGYGWTGITIAILAGNNPAFVPFAAFFMSYLNKGCNLMSVYSGVPSQLIDIIQAVIFLFFAAEQFLSGYRQKLVVRATQQELKTTALKAAAKEGTNRG